MKLQIKLIKKPSRHDVWVSHIVLEIFLFFKTSIQGKHNVRCTERRCRLAAIERWPWIDLIQGKSFWKASAYQTKNQVYKIYRFLKKHFPSHIFSKDKEKRLESTWNDAPCFFFKKTDRLVCLYTSKRC